jgi:hypothetical protein
MSIPMLRRAAVAILATKIVASLVACGDGDPLDPLSTVAGTYVLVSMNGQPLPHIWYEDHYEIEEIVAVELTLKRDGNCSATSTERVTSKLTGGSEVDTETDPCVYRVSGNSISISFDDWSEDPDLGPLTGTISGGTISLIPLPDGTWYLVFHRK